MNSTLFSICIPVRNDPANLRKCLAGLSKQDLNGCEVIVCDDGSSPALSLEELNDVGLAFTLIRQPAQGPSAARNHLARVAGGTYLFFVDADTVATPTLIENAGMVIASHPGIDAFYGAYDDDPAYRTLVSSYKNLLHHYTHLHSASENEQIRTFWCGCGVIRRQLYLEVGGLSEFYDTPSIEDIELGSRLSAKNIPIRIFPQLQVKHLKRWTLRNWLFTDVFRRGIPWVRLMRSTNDWASQLNFSWTQRMANFAALTFVLCLLLMLANPLYAVAGVLALAAFLVPNLDFIDLVRRKRGLMRAIAVVPLHIIYALVCVASVFGAFLYPPLRLPPTPKLLPLYSKE